MTSTPERQKIYHLSSPIAERGFTVYRHASHPELDLINGREPYRYGMFEGSVTYDKVLATSEIPFEPVFVQNYQEAAEAMRSGRVDAVICESMMDSAFETYPDIAYQKYYPLAYTTVSLATVNPEILPIIEVFQKYLDAGGTEELFELNRQGQREYLRHKLMQQLTDEERNFVNQTIDGGRAIPVVAEFDNYPASFYNWQEKEWQGVSHDILHEIESLTGLRFDVVNKPEDVWRTILAMLKNGEASVITHLAQTRNRDKLFLWPSTPYMLDNCALLSRSDTEDIAINRVRSTRVGLIRGTAYEEAFYRVFPDCEKVCMYEDTIAGFKALEKGEVELVMMTRNLLLSATNYMEMPDFKINVPLDVSCNSYFGVDRDQPQLCSVLDKAQSMVETDQIADRWRRKVFDYSKKITEERVPYLIAICMLLAAVLGLVIVLFTTKVRASDRRSMTDHLTGLANRRSFDKQLQEEWARAIKDRLSISLLTVDVDHFKKFNDTYGHQQGDVVLKTIGGVLRDTVRREKDFAARIGGEEFGVILPNTDMPGAWRLAEKIRLAVAGTIIQQGGHGGEQIQVTVSAGAATIRPTPSDSMEEFQCLSDTNLYQAKRQGRNRVCCV